MDPDDAIEISQASEATRGQETEEQSQERKLREAAREIMTSERSYVEALRLLCVDFKSFMENKINGTKKNIIPPADFQKIFKTLPNLLKFNEENLLKDFEERIENWDTNPKIADVLKTKGRFLLLYQTYVDEYDVLRNHFKKCCEVNNDFKEAVKEFETQPQCKNLKLSFYFHKPVQRLLQYKILLDTYLKYLPKDSTDFDDTVDALKVVTDVGDQVNEAVRNQVSKHFIRG